MTARNQLTIRLHNSDNVVVAHSNIPAGTEIPEEKPAAPPMPDAGGMGMY